MTVSSPRRDDEAGRGGQTEGARGTAAGLDADGDGDAVEGPGHAADTDHDLTGRHQSRTLKFNQKYIMLITTIHNSDWLENTLFFSLI